MELTRRRVKYFGTTTLIIIAELSLTQAAYFNGHYAAGNDEKFAYLSKFAFEKVSEENTKVSGAWEIQVKTSVNNTYLVVFDDEANNWPLIYGNPNCGCDCSTGEINHHYKVKEFISPMTEEDSNQGWSFKGEVTDVVKRHWWYFTIASCGQPFSGEYSLHVHHANGSEFSADQAGLMTLYATLIFCWPIIAFYTLRASSQLQTTCRFHTIARLFAASVVCNNISVLLFAVHFAVFSRYGVGLKWQALAIAEGSWTLGKLLLCLALLLAAKGFGITTAPLSNTERWHLLAAATLLSAVYIATAIWEMLYRDDASPVYVYDSPPGIAINTVHVILALWFCYSASVSYYYAPQQLRCIFAVLIALFGLYFLLIPLISVIGRILDPCFRTVVLETVEALVTTVLASVVAALLSWPATCEQYLPALEHDPLLGATGTYDEL